MANFVLVTSVIHLLCWLPSIRRSAPYPTLTWVWKYLYSYQIGCISSHSMSQWTKEATLNKRITVLDTNFFQSQALCRKWVLQARKHLPFPSRYLADCGFDAVNYLILKKQYWLDIIKRWDLRVKMSELVPNIKSLQHAPSIRISLSE